MTLENGSDLESKFLEVLKKYPKGATQENLQQFLPTATPRDLAELINKFLAQDKLSIFRKNQKNLYVLKSEDGLKKPIQTADIEEKIVYEAVKRAGDNGVAPRQLKFSTNLPQPTITKLLKSMEAKRLVKAVVGADKRKVFMLFDFKPSNAVTGGTFFNGQEFESEYVEVLAAQCHQYLANVRKKAELLTDPVSQRHASFKSSKDVCDFINELKISKVELKLPDIEKILEALIYDDKIEKTVSLSGSVPKDTEMVPQTYYRVKKSLLDYTALTRMPCGVCPVYNDCGKGRDISPSTCIYVKEWLNF